jgi:alanyl-tRNA synthetase
MTVSMNADQLRDSFRDFFAAKDHIVVPSASLIPHDPTVLFNVAGMLPFKPYFVGDEQPPFLRAVSSQKCARAGGKHNDLDDVGRTKRHLVFFEMLGNFSFGDYFKESAIPWSWDLVTGDPAGGGWGFDGDRLWITVHETDDEAERSGTRSSGSPWSGSSASATRTTSGRWATPARADRAARSTSTAALPSDPTVVRSATLPATGSWSSGTWCSCSSTRQPDGTRTPLPKPSIDTGAGLERILALLQGVDSVWETDLMAPTDRQACSVTGKTYRVGDYDDRDSFAMRVLAEHARSGAMLVSDGVFPSNEARGYVLRRIIRRAVRYAYLLGTDSLVMPRLTEVAIDVMGNAYPDIVKNRDFVVGVMTKEEERFRQTLKTGLGILDGELEANPTELSGSTAFLLHDTYGFPLEVTQEITAERNVAVDLAGFTAEMSAQRERAKAAQKGAPTASTSTPTARSSNSSVSPSSSGMRTRPPRVVCSPWFPTRRCRCSPVDSSTSSSTARRSTPSRAARSATPARSSPRRVRPRCSTPPSRFPTCTGTSAAVEGQVDPRAEATARSTPSAARHPAQPHRHPRPALGAARGAGRPRQAAGLAGRPDRLRFDFSHYEAVTPTRSPRSRTSPTPRSSPTTRCATSRPPRPEAEALGAIAFFGDKYGDIVRVLEAGRHSIELCGGTHVRATGDIGPVKIVSEASIGSNLRRIEAVTGVQRRIDEAKALQEEIKSLRAQLAMGRAGELAAIAHDGVLVTQVDGLNPGDLRELAIAVRQHPGMRLVVLIGETTSGGVGLVAAVESGGGWNASELLKDAARAVGGGGGGKGDIATAGGKDVTGIPAALELAAGAAAQLVATAT